MLGRRQLLALGAGIASFSPTIALAQSMLEGSELRGAMDASEAGIVADVAQDQSLALQALINDAARKRLPVFLPPGKYTVSDLDLPDGARLTGIAGASRLLHGGRGPLLRANTAQRIELSDLVLDGGSHALPEGVDGLLNFVDVGEVLIDNCTIAGSGKIGLRLERCGGRIERSTITGAGDMGLYAVESSELSITGNRVSDCGNGGILVHRWEKGPDGTMISGNRVSRIGAKSGGTGEYGNGINLHLADNVMITGNHVSDCAFSAIRANSASNVQITGNQCLKSGETAIYAEFAFEGAVIADNLIDGAANGILVVNFNEGGRIATVSGNMVRNLSLTGPYLHDGAGFGFGISVEADTVVTGNTIEGAPRYGMMLGWGPYLRDVVVSANVIRDTPIGIYVTVAEQPGTALIEGNIFGKVSEAAILGYRWNERATDDLFNNPGAFKHLTILNNTRS